MIAWVTMLCLTYGVCVEPTDTAKQVELREKLWMRQWWRPDPEEPGHVVRGTCQTTLFSSCPPVLSES